MQNGDEGVVITGGDYTKKIVSKYDRNGWVEDLPQLNTGRYYHACGSFSRDGIKVKLNLIKLKFRTFCK